MLTSIQFPCRHKYSTWPISYQKFVIASFPASANYLVSTKGVQNRFHFGQKNSNIFFCIFTEVSQSWNKIRMGKWQNIHFCLWLIYSLHGLDDRSYHKQQLMLNDVSGVTGREMTEPLGFRKVLGNSFNPWGVSTTTRDRNPITLTSVNEGKSRENETKKGICLEH